MTRSLDPPASADAAGLRRTLGLWQLTVSGVGIVIGAGIYVLIGEAARDAGNAVWLAFVVAALLASLTDEDVNPGADHNADAGDRELP